MSWLLLLCALFCRLLSLQSALMRLLLCLQGMLVRLLSLQSALAGGL
jgi:hypothetical protein